MWRNFVWTGPIDCGVADLYRDDRIDFKDLAVLAQYWFASDCKDWDWCYGADINRSNVVGRIDLAILAQCWLEPKMQ